MVADLSIAGFLYSKSREAQHLHRVIWRIRRSSLFFSSFFSLNLPLPLHSSLQMNPLAADLSYNVQEYMTFFGHMKKNKSSPTSQTFMIYEIILKLYKKSQGQKMWSRFWLLPLQINKQHKTADLKQLRKELRNIYSKLPRSLDLF